MGESTTGVNEEPTSAGPDRELEGNLASLLEAVADASDGQVAVIQGDRRLSWPRFDDRAARLAGFLAGHGVGAGSRVGIALYNSPEYLIALFAVLKLRATPVNVNYRYRAAELRHVLADSSSAGIVFDASLAEVVAQARGDLPGCRVGVPVGATTDAATPDLDRIIATTEPRPRVPRGGEDWLLYTGGTTGLPKAVYTPQAVMVPRNLGMRFPSFGIPTPTTVGQLHDAIRARRAAGHRAVAAVVSPLMHGTGIYSALGTLAVGGTVVLLPSRSYRAAELVDAIERHGVTSVALVGDVFAGPLADALDEAAAAGRPADISTLQRIQSVGALWSTDVKRRLLAHGDLSCDDTLAATEGGPYAVSVTTRETLASGTVRFTLASGARLLDDEDNDVVPGSGKVGVLAAPAHDDAGYLNDPDKSAVTFRTVDGQVYSVPGDMATVDSDGTLVLLGRGSSVINTGGEKVYTEEVERVLRDHPDVLEACVVGVPDPHWGNIVAAVVALREDASADQEALRAFVGAGLADYKKPKKIVRVDALRRTATGKIDLRWAHERLS